jgi:glucose/mannose transport system permease protein
MTTASPAATKTTSLSIKKRRFKPETLQTILLLLPSLIAIAIFVYLFIGSTFYVSLTNWRTLKPDMSLREPLYQTYVDLFASPRWQADLRNTVVFTVFFLLFSVTLGLSLAIILDHKIAGKPFFRNVILFPYALSFVVTGVVWRWLFNPETGINLFFEIFRINALLAQFGLDPIQPGWATNPDVLLPLNNLLGYVWPAAGEMQIKMGIPAAMVPVAIAATWQLSGFVMAMYLGGMVTISNEIREAARIDGASELQLYRHIVIPMLRPITISVVVILLHVSLKIFDLVWTMAGVGPGFATDVPAIFVFEQMFRANRFNLASAASIIMLILVALVIVPYLASTLRKEEQ